MNWATVLLQRISSEPGRTSARRRRATRLRLDTLEAREVPAALALDMDTSTSPTAAGFTRAKLVTYTASNHAGWQATTGMGAVSRTANNALLRDFHYGKDGTYLADLPNGTYDLVVGLGDASAKRDFVSVWAEGTRLAADATTQTNQFLEVRGRVTVTDGQLTLRAADAGGSSGTFAVTFVNVAPVNPHARSLWPTGRAPATASSTDRQKVELGVRFQVEADGYITGIRFFKGSANTGIHTGSLWAANGTRLANATFTGETATGWQTVKFATPIQVQAGQTYTASYLAPKGGYAFDSQYFALSGLTSGSLKVLPTAQGGGGVYKYGGGFPTQTYQNGSYAVDVVYTQDLNAPTVDTVTPADGATAVATSTAVTVKFSEQVSPSTVSTATVQLKKADGSVVPATVAYDLDTWTATLTPSAPLVAGATYTVLVKGGATSDFDPDAVRDAWWNAMEADFTSTFTTASTGGGPPTANAGADKSSNEGSSVSFTGTAGGGTGTLTYEWDWGDGSAKTTGTLTPSHTFADNGTYTVTLTVTDANNETATDTAEVVVSNVAPTASVSNNGPVNVGANVTISFANQNDVSAPDRTAGYRYSYDFNNDGTWDQTDVTSATATTSYASAGSKTVKARIKDKDGGATDYTTTVTVNGAVSANAGTDKTSNEASSVSFTGTASGGTAPLTYEWDWGDGSAKTTGTLTPSHTFADNGTYTVTLTVTDANSNQATDTAIVTVNNVAPTASVSNNGPVNVGANVTISFANQNDVSAPDRNAGYTYSYDFNNDGTWDQTDVTSATASTSYATAGSKTVKARIKDKDGGLTDYTTTVQVNGPPTADAGADKTSNEGSSVSFTGTAGGGTGTLTYEWDWGDGSAKTTGTLTPSHTFVDNGTYTVTLKVTDGNAQTATDTATVTVSNVAPTASVSNNGPVNVGANVTISFANQNDVSSADRNAGYTYSYDFNNDGTWDQTDVTSATASTSYSTAGSKTVTTRIKDKDGGSTNYTTTVTVNGPPTADAGVDKTSNEGSSVSFTGTAGGGTGTLTYEWDWGDGSAKTTGTLTPSHTFADNGTYTVTLKVTDGNAQTATDTATVTVSNVAPTASVSNNGPVNVGANVTISFANQDDVSTPDENAGFTYSYDFNNDGTWDQTDVTSATATTSYSTAGSKTVTTRIKDKDGGSTNYTTTVQVNDPGQGPTFYVATNGNDSNNGSSGSPWRTLQKAANTVVAGDTVVVRAGTYEGFQITRDGTASQRITFKADPGVVVNSKHSSASAFSGAINLEGADYITIDGFNVKMATSGSVRTNIRAVENTGVVIRNNVIDDASWWGILTGNSANVLIENNTVTDTINEHGIYVGNSADNPVVRGNRVENSRSAGIQINADKDLPGDGIISNALVENNVLLNNARAQGSSMNLNGIEDALIRNNLIASEYRNGMAIYQENQTAGCKRNKIIGNTIVGPAWYAISVSGAGTVDNQFRNNILISQAGWAGNARGGLGVQNITGLQSDYNILVGKVNRDPSNTESPAETKAQWQARGFDTHSIFLEDQYSSGSAGLSALFVGSPGWPPYSAASGDYRLKSGSPAINVGVNSADLPTDILGVARPSGSSTDIGAYEFNSSGDNQAPTVSVTSPSNNATVSGTVNLAATASDNVGVVGVQFYIDGVAVGPEDTSSPYGYAWASDTVGNGAHQITAKARDAAGNIGTSAVINVTTNNANPGLVGAWGFNEGSGSTVGSTVGGLTGNISGATWNTGGKFGQALSFDGVNDIVTVADADRLDLTTGMTLEAWVKPTSLSGWDTVIMKERTGGLNYSLYAADDVANRPVGQIETTGGYKDVTGSSSLALNTWSHLAVTYDGANIKLYVNGTLVSTTAATGNITTSNGQLAFGGNSAWGEHFHGLIDEVRIYNRALTQAEIQSDRDTAI